MQWFGFSPFQQLAWVTPDLDRSMAQFAQIYHVPDFFVLDLDFPATLEGKEGVMSMRAAMVNVDGVELELIQPKGGDLSRVYADALPADGSHANVFHHICVKVPGTEDDWYAYLAGLSPERRICFSAAVEPDLKVVYTDERHHCGLYIEHLWCGPESGAMLLRSIPRFTSPASVR